MSAQPDKMSYEEDFRTTTADPFLADLDRNLERLRRKVLAYQGKFKSLLLMMVRGTEVLINGLRALAFHITDTLDIPNRASMPNVRHHPRTILRGQLVVVWLELVDSTLEWISKVGMIYETSCFDLNVASTLAITNTDTSERGL